MNTHDHHVHDNHPRGRPFAIGIAVNSAFVAAEIIYGLKAGSLALLADAGHNASDVLGLCMAWGAVWLSRRKASERFTYGLQSVSIIAALANALLLLVAVGGIGWEAFERFGAPQAPAAVTVMAVAAIGVLINGITAWLFSGHHHDLNIRGVYLHMAADAAISLGVVISGAIILETGWLWVDPLVSLVIVVVIVIGTWRLLHESGTLALHAAPLHIDTAEVRNYLAGLEGVTEVHDLHIWAMSTTGVAMSAHLLMPSGHPGDAFLRHITQELEQRFDIHHATLQIEIGDESEECHTGCEQHL
jgi:cobalt-zinc-cadmium efflux system protein